MFFGTFATAFGGDPEGVNDLVEFVEFSALTEDEKIEIVQKSILPRHCQSLGLDQASIEISDVTLRNIIRSYTQEAGVRQISRQMETICHKCATEAFALGIKARQSTQGN